MQEEVENRTLTLTVNATKFTGRVLKAALSKYLAHRKNKKLQKSRDSPDDVKPYGKVSMEDLKKQYGDMKEIDLQDKGLRSFDRIAREYKVQYFKRSRRLLLARRERLSDEDRAAVDVMLRFSDRLLQAYALKEAFYHFMDAPDRPTALRRLDFWLDACDRLELPEFKSCRKTLVNWKPYILNAFDFRLSNGFTEGYNNAIKTLKRVAFGFRNFRSFRARILLSLGPYPNI